ncbi:hypothetical protein E6O75_ATG05498 [Venturia nashicola]|uniref:Uncharacterized protein n=1 Tax=Venturia nashicola TaxID=86259 RepID=A0A4Z1PGJ5_9PEZI|nr:hypothetical protein E6O75_ATG05498 [Venturia nashicola]
MRTMELQQASPMLARFEPIFHFHAHYQHQELTHSWDHYTILLIINIFVILTICLRIHHPIPKFFNNLLGSLPQNPTSSSQPAKEAGSDLPSSICQQPDSFLSQR